MSFLVTSGRGQPSYATLSKDVKSLFSAERCGQEEASFFAENKMELLQILQRRSQPIKWIQEKLKPIRAEIYKPLSFEYRANQLNPFDELDWVQLESNLLILWNVAGALLYGIRERQVPQFRLRKLPAKDEIYESCRSAVCGFIHF